MYNCHATSLQNFRHRQVFRSLTALAGYDLYNSRCRSLLDDVTDASSFRYEPESFNVDPTFADGYWMARNVKAGTESVDVTQFGGVCLSRVDAERPSFVIVSQNCAKIRNSHKKNRRIR